MTKKITMTAMAVGCTLVLAACGDKSGDTATSTSTDNKAANASGGEVLKIATEGAYAPFNFTNPDGTLGGFDVDVANALCDKMQVKCEIGAQDWDGIIPALMTGKYDAIVSAMSITPERSQQVAFTQPYFVNTLVFLAKSDKNFDPTNQADINSNSIAAQRSTISSQWLEQTHPNATAKLYDTLDNAFMDLGAGRADVMVSDKLPALSWLKSDLAKGFVIKGDDIDINDEMAIAVRKDDTALLERINTALNELKADGTYEALVVKHFGEEMKSSIPQSAPAAEAAATAETAQAAPDAAAEAPAAEASAPEAAASDAKPAN